MIAVVHYTDENLIAMLEAGDEEAIARNQHLGTCETCRKSLDEYRSVVRIMADEATWDTRDLHDEPNRSTVATLRAFATSMQREDEEAETYVAAMLEGPRETWMPRLKAHPEWRTAGVVRKLVADAYGALTRMPLDGVEMTTLAIEIAGHIPDSQYHGDTVARLRGHAWREHAYGLFYVGDFKQSLAACDRADAELSHCVVDEYDRARVGVVRALGYRAFDRLPEAAAFAVAASDAFASFGDSSRVVSAAVSAVHVQFKARDFRGALRILLRLASKPEIAIDNSLGALIAGNLGYCYRELGEVESAINAYRRAVSFYEATGATTEITRIQWNLAALLGSKGNTNEALTILTSVRSEFYRLAMHSEYIIAGLDIAELLLVQSRADAAEAVCREVAACLETAGLSSTTRAMTAVAYLEQAIRSRAASANLVRHVRNYVRRLPEDPHLVFAPPLQ